MTKLLLLTPVSADESELCNVTVHLYEDTCMIDVFSISNCILFRNLKFSHILFPSECWYRQRRYSRFGKGELSRPPFTCTTITKVRNAFTSTWTCMFQFYVMCFYEKLLIKMTFNFQCQNIRTALKVFEDPQW